MRKTLTKIVATLGGASSDAVTIRKMAEAGASVFRLNFSHGTFESHGQLLAAIREVEAELGSPLGVLGDLSGPKIRIGPVQDGGVELEAGQDVIIQAEEIKATGPRFSTTHSQVIRDIQPGQRVLINDGAIRMLVIESNAEVAQCRVTHGGLVTSGKGINLPNTTLTVPGITEKDFACLEWAVANELDFVALSFVREADDVVRLRRRMTELLEGTTGRPLPIVAKIERPEGVANIDAILHEVDAIMVARGDLGVEMDLAEVPAIQKRLVARARLFGKPCIVATQMLESMIESPSPTRAEASDVANAILDGADAVMLSGETAVGAFPIVAVDTMSRIAEATEAYECTTPHEPPRAMHERMRGHWTAAIAHGAWEIARDVGAKLIIAGSESGVTALHLSQNNFRIPVIIGSSQRTTLRRISILQGVTPVEMATPANLDEFTSKFDEILLANGWVERGQPVVLIVGHPVGRVGSTNSLAVHYVGDPTTGYRAR